MISSQLHVLLLLGTLLHAIRTEEAELQDTADCQCRNGGACSADPKYQACSCPQGFIGTHCQQPALEISEQPIDSQISQEYQYFYFEADEANYYQMNLEICLPQGFSNMTALIFLEVERNSGKVKLEPSVYQTSPMRFRASEVSSSENANKNCRSFYTHYIPIRKKGNEEFQRIIFGVAIKNNSNVESNRWINFLERAEQLKKENKSLADELFGAEVALDREEQVLQQKISISCTYELYLNSSSWGTTIIVASSITLIVSTLVFLYTLKTRFSSRPLYSNDQILRMYSINPEDYDSEPPKNDLTHFQFMMPVVTYTQVLKMERQARLRFPSNILKRRIEEVSLIQKQQELSRHNNGDHMFQDEGSLCHFNENEQNVENESKEGEKEQSANNCCTICLINFTQSDKVRRTPCKHIFHNDCIDNWCQNNLSCPICRQNLEIPRYVRRNFYRAMLHP